MGFGGTALLVSCRRLVVRRRPIVVDTNRCLAQIVPVHQGPGFHVPAGDNQRGGDPDGDHGGQHPVFQGALGPGAGLEGAWGSFLVRSRKKRRRTAPYELHESKQKKDDAGEHRYRG